MKRSHSPPPTQDQSQLSSENERCCLPFRTHRESLNSLFLNSPSCIAVLSGDDYKVEIANKQFDLFGKSPENIIGKHFFTEFPFLKDQGFEELFEQVYKTKEHVTVSEKAISLNGLSPSPYYPNTIYLSITLQPFHDSHGNVNGIFFHGTDITEHVRAKQELQNSKKTFNALHDANIVGIAYLNENGDMYDANDAFLALLGYTKTDVLRKKLNWFDLTAYGHKGKEHTIIKDLCKKGRVLPSEKEFVRKDGSTVPVIVGYAMPNKKNRNVVAIVLDITERKRLEERKDEFLGIASHELKTPLTSIKGYTQILERIIYQMGDERLKQYLQKTNNYIERLNSLISELLDVSKIQAGKLMMDYSEFSFDELLDETIGNMGHINSTHRIIREGAINENILGDRHRLEQVFVNLLSNAIKYSPKADKVYVRTKRYNGSVEVTIEDFGIGIAKEQQQNLFKRFYRVESSSQQFSGLGIGLYISSEIIRRHGGKIQVNSEEGKGSQFRFTIPVKMMPKLVQ